MSTRKRLDCLYSIALLFASAYPAQAQITYEGPRVTPQEFKGDVRDLPPLAAEQKPVYLLNENHDPARTKQNAVTQAQPNLTLAPMPAPMQNFAGMNFSDNVTGGRAGAGWPPDINGDVGRNHYIQAVNSSYAIYSKTGTQLAAFTQNSLWSGGGSNPCNGNSQGDPVVVYDQINDRWILTHFAFAFSGGNPTGPYYQCFAVSKTSDPVGGGWWLYPLRMDPGGTGMPPAGALNDYPKFGVWNDGCLYMSANEFTFPGGSYAGTLFASLNLANMEAGQPLTWSAGFNAGTSAFSMVPSNLLGTAASSWPAAGTPNYFVSESLSVFGLEVRKFTPGPNCGAGGVLAAPVAVSHDSYAFSSGNVVPQPNTSVRLDNLEDRVMQKVQYRKVGSAESLWVVHDVSVSPVTLQWVQLSVTGGVIATTAVQQQIFAPDTSLNRWMGSIAADRLGNAAIGYSTSNGTAPNFPSIAYAGRLVGDPLNNLPQTETVLIAGSGSQTLVLNGSAVGRWGDYTAMSIDPSDDCTFWYTNQYYASQAAGSAGNWQTRIGSFRFPSCTSNAPDLSIVKSHAGTFTQGQAGAQYSIVVSNAGGSSTSGPVTVTETLPNGLTATAISGTGWSCTQPAGPCTRSDALPVGSNYPAIILTVDVASNAPANVVNTAAVSGGGDTNPANNTAADPTIIQQTSTADLAIVKTHSGNFAQGQTGAVYNIVVSNVGPVSTAGVVTVTENVPTGLTATSMSGTGWACTQPAGPCTRSDALPAGSNYPVIFLVVNVAANAPAGVTNTAAVSGGGDTNAANNTASDATTIQQNSAPDLAITKTHNGNFVQGQTGAQYSIVISNAGNAASSGAVTVSDSVPGGLTAASISGTGWACTQPAGPCARSDALPAGSNYPAIVLSVNVAANAAASVTNTATVSGGGDANSANNSASDFTTVVPSSGSDLAIVKTHSGNFTQSQTGAVYSILVSNAGTASSSGTVTVTENVPTGLTATSMQGTGWSCAQPAGPCTRGDALPAGSNFPAINLTVNVAANAPSSVTNTVTVSGGGDTNAANNTSSDVTTIQQSSAPDLAIAKTHNGNFTQGQTGAVYSIVVSNAGTASSSGTVTVTENVPAGLTATSMQGTGWSCAQPAGPCTRADGLPVGSNYPAINLTVNVAANAAASVTNTATVSGGGDTNAANNTASDVTTITQTSAPDLAIAKTHNGTFVQGQTGALYTIVISNAGTASTTGAITVTENVPAGLTATSMQGTGWSCGQPAGPCTRGDALPAGSNLPAINLTVNVAANAPASVTNTATVSGGGDTNAANNTASDATTIQQTAAPDLAISKTHVGNFVQGQSGAYTIGINNVGAAASSGTVTMTDNLPAGLTATSIQGPGWTCAQPGGPCTRGDALPGSGVYPLLVLTVNVAANAAASVVNSASVSGGGDTNAANNTANDPTTIQTSPGPDLTIVKTHTTNFTPGQNGALFSILVRNAGTSASSGTVTVADNPPAGLTATSMQGTGWTCVQPAGPCTRGDALAAGNTYPSIQFYVNVAANAPPTVTNTATVSGGGDPNPANNTANDTVIIQAPSGADLVITKTHNGNLTQGQTGVVYSITVSNAGTASSAGLITVTDTLPASLTATSIQGSNWNCVQPAGPCTRGGALPAGSNFPPVYLTVNVAANAPPTVTNTVTVSGGGDTNPTNNIAIDPATVDQTLTTDLAIVKSHVGNFLQGQTGAQYSIIVTNIGSAASSGAVTVADNVPAGLTATGISGSGWACTQPAGPCTRADSLTPSASYAPIVLTVNVAANAPGSVTNTASVSGGGDTNPNNNTAADPANIQTQAGPDLFVVKSHSGNFLPGQIGAVYTIVISNSGTVASTGSVNVSDALPVGLTATAISGAGWTCAQPAGPCTRADALAAGGSYAAITLTVNVAANAPTNVINTATVSGGGDTNAANNTSIDPTYIQPPFGPDLAITKTHLGDFTQGQIGAYYTILVTNVGTATSTGTVTVNDILPAGLTATYMQGGGWSCAQPAGPCSRGGGVPAGSNYPPIFLLVNVAANAPANVTNTATVTGGGDINAANNTASDVTRILP